MKRRRVSSPEGDLPRATVQLVQDGTKGRTFVAAQPFISAGSVVLRPSPSSVISAMDADFRIKRCSRCFVPTSSSQSTCCPHCLQLQCHSCGGSSSLCKDRIGRRVCWLLRTVGPAELSGSMLLLAKLLLKGKAYCEELCGNLVCHEEAIFGKAVSSNGREEAVQTGESEREATSAFSEESGHRETHSTVASQMRAAASEILAAVAAAVAAEEREWEAQEQEQRAQDSEDQGAAVPACSLVVVLQLLCAMRCNSHAIGQSLGWSVGRSNELLQFTQKKRKTLFSPTRDSTESFSPIKIECF